MNFYFKNKGDGKAEAFIEAWDSDTNDWQTVCVAGVILAGDQCLIDTVYTPIKYRRKGYATALVQDLQDRFKKVAPIGVENTVEAQGFWEKFGMEDALGHEE